MAWNLVNLMPAEKLHDDARRGDYFERGIY
jgi:hypothetical protein